MAQRALNQWTCVKIINLVVAIASIVVIKTGLAAFRLQFQRPVRSPTKKNKVHRFAGALTGLEDVVCNQTSLDSRICPSINRLKLRRYLSTRRPTAPPKLEVSLNVIRVIRSR